MSIARAGAATVLVMAASANMAQAQGREQISIVGSSTVFPYTQAVAEQFANVTGAPSPIVESTGTGGGMQIFCGGIGEQHPDLTGASRAMRPSEYQLCQENGVESVSEALIGYDGLSIAISRSNGDEWDLTLGEVYQALGAQVPVDGEWVDNPHETWSDINPDLPDSEILVYGPPPTSGTRDAFVELAMLAGCEQLEYVESQGHDDDWIEQNCSRMRQDGPFVEAGENDNLIVQRLNADSNAMGIFGYSFLFENLDTLKPVLIEGVAPDENTIADFSYPIARPLYFYTKNAHRGVIPGFQEFIEEYMSEDALAPGGYLSERGLVPLGDDRRAEMQDRVINAVPMDAPAD
ncbi:substrate-binding domain-containing protein [Roseitranquillus sediminis]|uniref:substrate-binding domain-containing protein n=1 Tax=Roseitranquillus sediminis TaxID=2809051 RepID=UPI001D0CA1DA|nr:substrate-binding domain-containing protein [Roseitranquillus sediminis]MBM9594240.1 substrate-binding domain-containing protein [Roseitranquillus sediminis]